MQIENLSVTLSVLSAMVTPAVLILASSSLVLATSNRLSRAIDRTRTITERVTEEAKDEERTLLPEERELLLQQLGRTARRAKLLTRALTRLYTALAIFIATSMAIGVVAVTGVAYAWIALLLGFVGALLQNRSSLLLILESRIALTAVFDEMEYVQRLGQRYAPPNNLVERPRRPPQLLNEQVALLREQRALLVLRLFRHPLADGAGAVHGARQAVAGGQHERAAGQDEHRRRHHRRKHAERDGQVLDLHGRRGPGGSGTSCKLPRRPRAGNRPRTHAAPPERGVRTGRWMCV
ncbi:MAG TPA: DUF2721 domain-containing protein, partial [Longimicrobium sp.]|nr:DUF2721 domain-containing protein [Longimicrobium sp.]